MTSKHSLITISIFTALFSLTRSHRLASAAPVTDQLNVPAAHVLPRKKKGACHFQWPLWSDVKASVTGEGGNHPERQGYLMRFVTSSGCLSRPFALLRWPRGPRVSERICSGCSPPASLLAVTSETSQTSSGLHMKCSGHSARREQTVSQPAQDLEALTCSLNCTAAHASPVAGVGVRVIYLLWLFSPSSPCIRQRAFISPPGF